MPLEKSPFSESLSVIDNRTLIVLIFTYFIIQEVLSLNQKNLLQRYNILI